MHYIRKQLVAELRIHRGTKEGRAYLHVEKRGLRSVHMATVHQVQEVSVILCGILENEEQSFTEVTAFPCTQPDVSSSMFLRPRPPNRAAPHRIKPWRCTAVCTTSSRGTIQDRAARQYAVCRTTYHSTLPNRTASTIPHRTTSCRSMQQCIERHYASPHGTTLYSSIQRSTSRRTALSRIGPHLTAQ